MAALGLYISVQGFSRCGEGELLSCRLLVPLASVVAAHALSCCGCGLKSPRACGICLDQGSNLCALRC